VFDAERIILKVRYPPALTTASKPLRFPFETCSTVLLKIHLKTSSYRTEKAATEKASNTTLNISASKQYAKNYRRFSKTN